MTAFMLVPAAFHGGWVWERVADQLLIMGHKAIVPSFDADQMLPAAGLEAYVGKLLDLFTHLDSDDIVLVAQSFGGIVATVAAGRVPTRISALIYVDAVVPEHGKSMLETIPVSFADAYRARSTLANGRSIIRPMPGSLPGLKRVADRALVAAMMTAQPLASFEDRADFGSQRRSFNRIPRHYLHCSVCAPDPSAALYQPFAHMAQADRRWSYRELPVGFYGLLSSPDSVALAIIEAVHGASGGLSASCLRRVLRALDAAEGEQISVPQMAEIAGLSTWHFARGFKKSMGVSPHSYLITRRMARAADLLTQKHLNIQEIAGLSGFKSSSQFVTAFRQAVGTTPTTWRRTDI